MPTKKAKTSKKPAADPRVLDKLIDRAKVVKSKYHKLDDDTKKKIVVGIAGAITLLAGIRAVGKIKKKIKKARKK